MSHVCTGLVQRKRVGSPTRKAVLMFMAGCAADDGSGIWTSKSNMAADLEMGKRTVQVCIDDLTEAGLIAEVGRRPCKNGFTVEYQINMEAVSALESTRAGAAPVQELHPTGAGAARQDVQELHPNLTGTVLEPSPLSNGGAEQDQPAPKNGEGSAPAFSDFWAAWPNKAKKVDAERAWKKLKPDDRANATARIDPWFDAFRRQYPTASPILPASYLNGRRWEDEFTSAKPSTPSQHSPGARKPHWQLMQERGTV